MILEIVFRDAPNVRQPNKRKDRINCTEQFNVCNRFLNVLRVFSECFDILVILMYRFMNRAENKSILFSIWTV